MKNKMLFVLNVALLAGMHSCFAMESKKTDTDAKRTTIVTFRGDDSIPMEKDGVWQGKPSLIGAIYTKDGKNMYYRKNKGTESDKVPLEMKDYTDKFDRTIKVIAPVKDSGERSADEIISSVGFDAGNEKYLLVATRDNRLRIYRGGLEETKQPTFKRTCSCKAVVLGSKQLSLESVRPEPPFYLFAYKYGNDVASKVAVTMYQCLFKERLVKPIDDVEKEESLTDYIEIPGATTLEQVSSINDYCFTVQSGAKKKKYKIKHSGDNISLKKK